MIIYDDDGIGHDVVPRQVFDDIKTEIHAYFMVKNNFKHLSYDVERDMLEIINRHMKGGES